MRYLNQLPPPLKNHPLRSITAGIITLIITVLTINLFSSSTSKANNTAATANRMPITVSITSKTAQPKQQHIHLYGRTESNRHVTLMAETEGKITEILATEGSEIQEGDVIASIDIRNRKDLLKEAEALVKQRRLEHKVAKSLSKKGLQSETELAKTITNLKAAEARLTDIKQDIDRTIIVSPFNGTLETIHVEQGTNTKRNDTEIATIIDTNPLIAVGFAAEKDIHQIKTGSPATITIQNSPDIEGKIRYVSRAADKTTHTFRIEAVFDNATTYYPEGISANIKIPTNTLQAHHIPPSILTLNKKGILGVYTTQTLNNQHIATFKPITIIEEDQTGFWVTGLPEEISLITAGQGFVKNNTIVTVAQHKNETP